MTEARKRWKRTGRARLPGVREANGKPQRETVEDIKGVVKAARKRHGVPDAWLDNPDIETEHGRLRLSHELNQDQWETAEWYLDRRYDYLQAIGATWEAVDCERRGSSGSADPEAAHVRFCEFAETRWNDILECVRDASTQSRSPIKAAIDVILVQNKRMSHLNGDLKLGLNALVRYRRNMP